MKPKHLVLVGAGHAHLETLTHLEQVLGENAHATVISLGSYQYYSGMGPGLLSGYYAPGEVRFNVAGMARRHGADFIEGQVVRIDADRRALVMADRSEIEYDVASFNVGSVIDPARSGMTNCHDLQPVKPVERLFETRCDLLSGLARRDLEFVVIGGGAAGIEMAANAAALAKDQPHRLGVTLITRGEILKVFPARVRRHSLTKLAGVGVTVLERSPVVGCDGKQVLLESGQGIPYDRALLATGTRPPELFAKSGLAVGPTGGLLVGPHLNSRDYAEIFGGGDCIDFAPRPLSKVGVFAVRQNPVLRENLTKALAGMSRDSYTTFDPQRVYHLILNYGDRTGLSYRRPFTLKGCLAFRLKDRIDSSFMRKFQECGETEEVVECPENRE